MGHYKEEIKRLKEELHWCKAEIVNQGQLLVQKTNRIKELESAVSEYASARSAMLRILGSE